MERFDIAVIGGGVNGCGIARDAAGRGWRVLLCEQSDLGSGTSSASTKLVHGGLRYLEHYEFRLVREALIEREVLLRAAPHIIWPLRFVLPHHSGLRPAWLLRLGLFLYDHLGGRKLLPATRQLDLGRDPAGVPLSDRFRRAFEYSDCWVEDSRLVVLNAMDAAERGARIRVRTRCVEARRADPAEGGGWRVTLEAADGTRETIAATVLVNAAGPWVEQVLTGAIGANAPARVRLVQGSHIVVPRLFEHDRAYIFQNADGRIVFAIPYERDFTLIGTTDRDWQQDPGKVAISDEEIDYLCKAVSEYLATPVTRDQIVWTYSGVRPLYDDGASKAQEATRDYVLKLDGGEAGQAVLLNVFGGKITTYRKLAEAALARLAPSLPAGGKPWTHATPLPGGDFPVSGFEALVAQVGREHPFLSEATARRLCRAYGTRVGKLLGVARAAEDLGRSFGADLSEAEVDYLMRFEWARRAEDVAWRRSKLGLRLTREEMAALDAWMIKRAETLAVQAAE
ncbi:homodimeric glycerol 3-phosphate dehydrogenase (quinone) [Tistlia consotensis]|uniref:Glycerol-3-phosphate dehydrogenase n=1 Tax=Tistlia consotensis USBA 355 TaxID=560819 RepID=A0A1Y6BSI4_9PROT|nr:glycerol-3-phosphate dehydrogenase [Tistlia consotensis]SMF18740.1 homodimeric glycerol 3-phosphate dehydrogenase (quinone) [Tistlia consotensis USBA 355]SNR39425.1 homodimeric glycerol 3-phosphate dehydrogenase (quinone) [Tistlia consotensis]